MPKATNSVPPRFFPAMLAFVLVAVAARCDRGLSRPAGPPKKVSIASVRIPATAPIFVALEKGFFADAGLDVTMRWHVSGYLSYGDLLSGATDFATTAELPVVMAAFEGKPVVVVASLAEMDRSILTVARTDRGVSVGADLKGERIGVEAGTTAEFYLHAYLTTMFVDPSDVTITDIPSDRLAGALVEGSVDAICTWLPHTTVAQKRLDGKTVVLVEPGLHSMKGNLAVMRDLATRDPEVIVRVLRAFVMANSFIEAHPDEAMGITARETGIDRAAIRGIWPDLRFSVKLDQDLILGLEDQARWLQKKKGDGAAMPNFLNMIHARSLEVVSPEDVRIPGLRGMR